MSSEQEGLDWLGRVDLLHSSYALTYFSDPGAALRRFACLGARVMLWSRLPLTENRQFSVAQSTWLSANGPGPFPLGIRDKLVTYPETFLNRVSFEQIVSENYRILASYLNKSGDAVTSREHVKGRTYLLERIT